MSLSVSYTHYSHAAGYHYRLVLDGEEADAAGAAARARGLTTEAWLAQVVREAIKGA
jgi:hypothetical protein